MHYHNRNPALSAQTGQSRIHPQPPHIVDQVRPGIKGSGGNFCFIGVNRDRQIYLTAESLNDRQHPPQFYFGFNRLGPWPGAFPTHIKDMGALLGKAQALFNGFLHPPLIAQQAVAGKAIGGHIDDAHDISLAAPLK